MTNNSVSEKELRSALGISEISGTVGGRIKELFEDLATQYLDCKGFPEEEIPNGNDACMDSGSMEWNSALHLCKLAHLKDKERVLEALSVEKIAKLLDPSFEEGCGKNEGRLTCCRETFDLATSIHQLLKDSLNG